MKVEIIAIGTELLMGQVVNTNASVIAQELLGIGLGIYYQQVVGDNPARMEEALELAESRSDIIILSGGIGPTQDDVTKQVVSQHLKVPLVEDPQQMAAIHKYLDRQGRQMTANQPRQALTFEKGETFINHVGLACGVGYRTDQHTYIIIPGPPYEMKVMMRREVKPYLQSHLPEQSNIASLYLNFYGVGESQVAMVWDDFIRNQSNPTLAVYAKPNQVVARLTANAPSQSQAQALNQALADQLIPFFQEYFIGYGEDWTLEAYIIQELLKQEKTLSLAESLTAGLVAGDLANVPGASQVLFGSLVTYQTQAKQEWLGIDSELIDKYSVYSPEVAQAMAEAALARSGTDYALGLTGVAGPGPDQGHPMGEVHISLAQAQGPTITRSWHLPDRPRSIIRENAKNQALLLLKKVLTKP